MSMLKFSIGKSFSSLFYKYEKKLSNSRYLLSGYLLKPRQIIKAESGMANMRALTQALDECINTITKDVYLDAAEGAI